MSTLDRKLVKNRYHRTSTENYDFVYFAIGPHLMGSADKLAMWFYMRECNLSYGCSLAKTTAIVPKYSQVEPGFFSGRVHHMA